VIRTRSQFAVLQAIGTTTNSSETYAYTVIHGRSSQSAFYDANDGRAGTWPASATEDSGLLFLRFFGIDVFIGGFRGGGEPGGRWRSVAVATTSHCGGLILETDGGKPGLYKVLCRVHRWQAHARRLRSGCFEIMVLSSAISERLAGRRPRPGG